MLAALLLVAALPAGCTESAPVAEGLVSGEGYVHVTGGKVWYEIVGSGTATPLLLLCGGPGAPSYYFNPLKPLADEWPVVFYDQLGCGRSDRPQDSTLWRMERFVEELALVRKELGLERTHILGHSWGTMLAVEYMLTRPTGVESLILAGPLLSVPRYLRDVSKLRAALPPKTRDILERHGQAGTTDSKEYQAAVMEYYRRHLCRLDLWPTEWNQTMAGFGWDAFHTMWGPSEFYPTGILKDFDRTDRLAEIEVPTFLTAGRYDDTTPEATAWYQSLIPGAQLQIFEDSSHMTMFEEPDRYVQAVRDFLRSVEGR